MGSWVPVGHGGKGDMGDIGMVYMWCTQDGVPVGHRDTGDTGNMGDMGDIDMVHMCVYPRLGARGTWGTWGTLVWYICGLPQMGCPWDMGYMGDMGDMGDIELVYMCVYHRLDDRGTWGTWGTLVWDIYVCTPDWVPQATHTYIWVLQPSANKILRRILCFYLFLDLVI